MKRGALIITIGCLLLAGCGGSSDGGKLTKAEFRKQAAAICKKASSEYEERLKAAAEKYQVAKLSNQQRMAIANEQIALPTVTKMVERLSSLGIPNEESDAFRAFVSSYENAMHKAEHDDTALVQGTALTPARKSAKAAGIESCAAI